MELELDLEQIYDIHDIYNLLDLYFYNFKTKNIKELEKMFDDKVKLRDWNIEVTGKSDVVAANQDIFDNTGEIQIKRLSTLAHESGLTFSELILTANGEEIKVLDVIVFNDDSKITSIRAYKG